MKIPKYDEYIKSLPCCYCSHPAPSDPHHCGNQGSAKRNYSERQIPFCRACHTLAEQYHLPMTREEQRELAERLYKEWSNETTRKTDTQ